MKNIRGFIQIADRFYTSGQPTGRQFEDVRDSGVRLVVNLAMPDSDYALAHERETVESLGMDYAHIPVPFSSPTLEQFIEFERELLARKALCAPPR